MQKFKLLIALLIIIGTIGLAFFGNGISGMIIFDQTVKPICQANNDCPEEETCCLFYEEDSGVCHSKDMCDLITLLTKREKEEKQQAPMITSLKTTQKDMINNYQLQTIFGLGIIILTILAFYELLNYDNIQMKKTRYKHKKTRKQRTRKRPTTS